MLRETIAEIGMSTENVKNNCPAKPITYACQIGKHVKESVERAENMNITVNGCLGKISPKKVGIHQMLHSYETWHFPHIDPAEQILKARVS